MYVCDNLIHLIVNNMNIEFESPYGQVYQIEVTITSYSYNEDIIYGEDSGVTIVSEDYELKFESIPEGSTQQEVEDHVTAYYLDELIEEYQEAICWKEDGMEFNHYN